ncbi:MAG: PDZ domain-containing protein [Caldithrix sp.]|nr:PDZ domain-containing protein [Caldithrix sp.]
MRRSFIQILSITLTITLLVSPGFMRPLNADEDDYYFRLKKSWQYMQRVYEKINQHYVEEVDPYNLITAGIDGMLDELDPYTDFIEEEGQRRLKIITTGKYGGLGMEIGLRNGEIVVISPIENTPAKKMGIRAGDIIKEINGKSISGWSVRKVSAKMRGKIGTEVKLLIERPGIEETFEVTLERAEIVIEDIGYAGYIEEGTGYVSLNGFTNKSPEELRQALRELKYEGNLQRVILDLRDNPGGLLEAAVQIVNLFVEKDAPVVSTKGFREESHEFKTRFNPMLPNIPLVVMVNGGSASASEIVAGALQDLDRAVIMGEPTYGKGLVQKVYNLDKYKETKLKMTTAKYYIPSGRCIQKKDYGLHNEVFARDSSDTLDNEEHAYYTRNKRVVYDKGGIYPDIIVEDDSMSYFSLQLLKKNLLFDFAVQFHSNQPDWLDKNVVTDSILMAFREFGMQNEFKFDFQGHRELKRLKQIADNNQYSPEIKNLISELESKLNEQAKHAFDDNRQQIKKLLHLELVEKYAGRKARYKYTLKDDQQIARATEVLKDMSAYNDILAIQN